MNNDRDIKVQLEIDHETVEVSRLTARITLLWNRLHRADPTAAMELADWLTRTQLVPPGFHNGAGRKNQKGPT